LGNIVFPGFIVPFNAVEGLIFFSPFGCYFVQSFIAPLLNTLIGEDVGQKQSLQALAS
jgi:hypothetical protein